MCWVLFFVCVLSFVSARPLQVHVSAESAVVMNIRTGSILYDKEMHKPLSPASITKIATALYAIEKAHADLDQKVIAPKDVLKTVSSSYKRQHIHGMEYVLESDGTRMGLVAGEEVSVRDLLYGLMLVSGNDAANVLACHVSGNVPQFVKELNEFLQQKGIMDTHFCNPHGLYFPGHTTTAYDMARITQLACAHASFREIVKSVRYTCPPNNKRVQPVNFVQTNKLLKPGKFFYPKACGIKTGYTSQAKHTFVAAAADEDRELVVVLMGCPSAEAKFQDALSLFKSAFAEQKVTRHLFVKEDILFFCPIKGKQASLGAYLGEDIAISYFPAEEPDFKIILEWFELSTPVNKGQHIGELKVLLTDGSVYLTRPLYSAHALERTFSDGLRQGYALWQNIFTSVHVRIYVFALLWIFVCYFLYKHLYKKRLVDRKP